MGIIKIIKNIYFYGITALNTVIRGLYYFFGMKRYKIRIDRLTLKFPTLPHSFNGVKIVLFSDVHLGHFFNLESLNKLVQQIQELQPDMILFAGDYVDKYLGLLHDSEWIISKLQAPLGKFAVLGNHDYYVNEHKVRETLINAGFTLLENKHVRIHKKEEQICIAGVEDMIHGKANINKAIRGIPKDEFIILLAHEPDIADLTAQHPIHLQLSGHSHGGQIRLPFIGHMITPLFGKKYVDRLNIVGKLKVYTNRGIGTTSIPIRLFCNPEITVIELER